MSLPLQLVLSIAATCHFSGVDPEVMQRLVKAHATVESSLQQYAIHDNTADASYYPTTLEDAVQLVTRLRAANHSIDVGPMGLNYLNWPRFGLDARTVFTPRANICAGVTIIAEAYDRERRVSCIYVSGKPDCPPMAAKYPGMIAREMDGPTAPPSAPASPTETALAPPLKLTKGAHDLLVFKGDQ